MLTLISCPTCHHKFTIPEGAMGERHTCPNCQSLFVAGKSVAEAPRGKNAPSLLSAGMSGGGPPAAGMDKTMLGEVEAMIKYNCPRCKKALQAPASEAGTKKPCPACGGRLQVPAAPPVAATDPLNKTLLASDESVSRQPAVPASPYGSAPASAAPVPSVASVAPAPAPAPAGIQRRHYIFGGLGVLALALVVLFLMGKHAASVEQEKFMAAQKLELEKLKADIDLKTKQLELQKQLEAENRKAWEAMVARHEERQRELDRQRDLDRKNQEYLADKRLADEAKARAEQRQRELDDERRAAADRKSKAEADLRNQIETLRKQVENANQKTTTIINSPPPAYPWYYGRPYPWW